jgi:hypothetical protein
MPDPTFRVTFFKNLLDGSGHPHDCAQASVEINAPDECAAITKAQRKFAALEEVESWDLRADRYVVQLLSESAGDSATHATTALCEMAERPNVSRE